MPTYYDNTRYEEAVLGFDWTKFYEEGGMMVDNERLKKDWFYRYETKNGWVIKSRMQKRKPHRKRHGNHLHRKALVRQRHG